jgi:hypothetical protein
VGTCQGSRCWVRAQRDVRSEGQHGGLCELGGVKDAAIHATAAWKAGTLGKQSRSGPRRGEALLFGIANATRGPMREAERSPRPGTRDPANEEPLGTNAPKPQVPSIAGELCCPPGGALYRRTCIEQHSPFHDPAAMLSSTRFPTLCPASPVPGEQQHAQPPCMLLRRG